MMIKVLFRFLYILGGYLSDDQRSISDSLYSGWLTK